MNSRLAICLYLATVLAVANAGEEGSAGDLETSKNEIVDLILEKFEGYNIDFSDINGKLKLLGLPQLNPNLLQLVLETYNTSTEEIADIIVQAKGNPNAIIPEINELFECQLFYIQDDIVGLDQGNVDRVIKQTKDKYIKDVSANHKILGYILKTFVSKENNAYYPELAKKVQEIQIPLKQIALTLQPVALKAATFEAAITEVPSKENVWNQIADQFKDILSSVASSLEDIFHKALNEMHSSLMALYKDGEPENFFEEAYAQTVNVLVLELEKLLIRADELVDQVLDRFVTVKDLRIIREIREVANPPQLGFTDKLLQNINRSLKRIIHSGIVVLNDLTGSTFVDLLETLEVLLGGLVNKVFPDKEILNYTPSISHE